MTVEELLVGIRDRAALIGFLATSGTLSAEPPSRRVLAGLQAICEDVETMAERVARALDIETLAVEARQRSRR